jgi:Mu-like prophage tail sheath protein gpL
MNLNPNIPETMIPGTYTGYNYYAGPNGLPANIQKVLLIGDVSSAGSLAACKPTEVSSEQEAIALAGSGSVLMQMYKAAKKAWKYAQITLLRHASVSGSAATWESTLSGTATAAGIVSVIINGQKISVGVAKTDTAAAVATALAAEVNNTPDAPVTAEAASAKVTLTAKCAGAYVSAAMGGLNVSVTSEATGITAGAVSATAGVGTVDLTTALAAAFPERFHIIVSPVNDETNLGYLKTHLEAAAAPLEQRGQRAVCAMVSATATAAKTEALKHNYERLHIAAVKTKLNATVWEIAAGLGAIFASNSKPNVPMNGVAIPGLAIPEIEDKWSGEEQDVLLYAGVIPLAEEDGLLCIVRAVTTKSNNSGVRFTKLIDTGVIASLDYFRDAILSTHKAKFKNKVIHALLADSINEENKKVAKDLEDEEILRYIDDYADQFITQESKNEPGRMLCQIPAPVVPGLNQIYNTIDLYL